MIRLAVGFVAGAASAIFMDRVLTLVEAYSDPYVVERWDLHDPDDRSELERFPHWTL